MLLTLTTTYQPATDLGYLLRKNPARPQSFDLSFGKAHVFYPETSNERCTVALLVEVDPVGLVRNRRGPSGEGGALEQYVNDRPYAASSFLSVAIADVFGTALAGNSKERPELVDEPIPLQVAFSALPCRGGEQILRKLFEPLGYNVTATRLPLDDHFPDWGESAYFRVELAATLPLKQLLSHLYVLVPVLDNDKHYWVSDDEVAKLMRHGEGWLAAHPEREAIARRYLKHQRSLVDDALMQLADESEPDPDFVAETHAQEEEAIEKNISLNEQRLGAVIAALKGSNAARVLDLGCGEGRLLQLLLKEKQFAEIVGMDVSHRALEIAKDRLHYERMPSMQKERLRLMHGSLIVCRDEDAARKSFGVTGEGIGICYTRTGRRFFDDANLEREFLNHVQTAATAAGFWDEFKTGWLCLDCELMPWSAKAQELLKKQYAAVGASASASLAAEVATLEQAAACGLDVGELLTRTISRRQMVGDYIEAYRRYCWPVNSVNDLKLAPFHLLATEGAVHTDKPHTWHMETLARLAGGIIIATPFHIIDLTDSNSEAEGIRWWEELTGRGGEGMVVKPLDFIVKGRRGLVQPAVKCRGREYLRIIYGPEYTAAENLERLRARGLSTKRSLALREFALGIESLERFARNEPLRRVHEAVFGVLAMESEPVDPRL